MKCMLCCLAVLQISASDTIACAVLQRLSLTQAVARADALVEGRVTASRIALPSRNGQTMTMRYTIAVQRVVAGAVPNQARWQIDYSEQLGGTVGGPMCPVHHGSGIEFNIRAGQAYVFLLKQRTLVRALPLAKAKQARLTWGAEKWREVLPARLLRARLVLRASLGKIAAPTRKFEIIAGQVYKNTTAHALPDKLTVVDTRGSVALGPGSYTFYLLPGGKDARQWRLLGGSTDSGTSHFRAEVSATGARATNKAR